jgi:hypothetical protein
VDRRFNESAVFVLKGLFGKNKDTTMNATFTFNYFWFYGRGAPG